MSSFRITIVELKRPAGDQPVLTIPPGGTVEETKVFEQTVHDLDIRKFARDFNAPVRKRRNSGTSTATA